MVHFPFYDDRRAGQIVRRLFDAIIARLLEDPRIAAVVTRLELELVLADQFRDFDDVFVRELRRARDDGGGE
jgi:predicted nucleic acid-binding protein